MICDKCGINITYQNSYCEMVTSGKGTFLDYYCRDTKGCELRKMELLQKVPFVSVIEKYKKNPPYKSPKKETQKEEDINSRWNLFRFCCK